MKIKFDNIKNLQIPQFIEGIRLCFENAETLHKSAQTLKNENNFSVSMSLLVLSVEELMKSFALFYIMASESDEEKELYRDIFESNSNDLHSNRHNFALFFNEFFKYIDYNKSEFDHNDIDILQVIENTEKEKKTFKNWFSHANEIKNKGFYVAYNKKWFSPNRVTQKEFNLAFKETELIRSVISIILQNVLKANAEELDSFISELRLVKNKVISKYK